MAQLMVGTRWEGTMSVYEGFFGAKKLFGQIKTGADHFQIRPFAQHLKDDDPALAMPPSHPHPAGYSDAATVPVELPSAPPRAANGFAPIDPGQGAANAHVPCAPPPQRATPAPVGKGWNEQYDRSLDNIQDHIHAVAGAVAMLDAVEHKMIAIKLELQRIHDAGLMIDGNKVLVALQTLSDYVNQSIESVDDQCVNMLRDAKLDIRFAEMDTQTKHDGVALTMISLDRLLDYKIKAALAEGLVAEDTPEFVDDICAIVSSNIQVLTSIMLALFASRDYTQAVTKLAARERIIPTIEEGADPAVRQATIEKMQLASIDQQLGTKHDQLQQGRASLTALLKDLRANRSELSASFN